jgi:hypothetical protein
VSKITTYSFASHTTTSGTDLDEYLEAGGGLSTSGGWFNTKGASQVSLYLRRSADTGTCTLQAFAEFLYEPENVFYPIFDFAGTAVQGVQYANDATDSSASYHTLTLMRELPPGATTGKLNYNTIHNAYQCLIPEKLRFRIRSGGTTVTNTYSALITVHAPV